MTSEPTNVIDLNSVEEDFGMDNKCYHIISVNKQGVVLHLELIALLIWYLNTGDQNVLLKNGYNS